MSLSQGTQKPKYLQRRAVVPHRTILQDILGTQPRQPPLHKPEDISAIPKPDLDNIQGDVYYMFPKRFESFLFFNIANLTQFRKDLATYAPRITSSKKTAENILSIDVKGGSDSDIVSSGIAFSRAGLNKMDVTQKLGDPHFDQGSLFNEKKELGDMREYDPVFNGNGKNHGIILVATREKDSCREQMEQIKAIFSGSIEVVTTYEGRVRPDDGEHFGWRDGISQPALQGLSDPKPGQRVVRPGVVIMGYPGDPLYESQERPAFTKDGSFMVFRKLEQNVLFLEDYTNEHYVSIPEQPTESVRLNDQQRKDLFGARLVGRFKSGVPLALCPYIEDKAFLAPDKINNFNYTESTNRCPLSAHVRKTAPRNLQPIISEEFLDVSVIVRAGIPYGEEITAEERKEWEKLSPPEKENLKCNRGLLFVCYQASIHDGFYGQTTGFANNDFFPITSLKPTKIGQDPILGGPEPVHTSKDQIDISQEGLVNLQLVNKEGVRFEVSGVAQKVDTSATAFEQKFFVTSRGGEYYFVPPISTVKEWAEA